MAGFSSDQFRVSNEIVVMISLFTLEMSDYEALGCVEAWEFIKQYRWTTNEAYDGNNAHRHIYNFVHGVCTIG